MYIFARKVALLIGCSTCYVWQGPGCALKPDTPVVKRAPVSTLILIFDVPPPDLNDFGEHF